MKLPFGLVAIIMSSAEVLDFGPSDLFRMR